MIKLRTVIKYLSLHLILQKFPTKIKKNLQGLNTPKLRTQLESKLKLKQLQFQFLQNKYNFLMHQLHQSYIIYLKRNLLKNIIKLKTTLKYLPLHLTLQKVPMKIKKNLQALNSSKLKTQVEHRLKLKQ